ncbi:hypothetical protein K458DRAFT_319668 [Lentithecium fluviatile CBS 122367]|uniref:Eukaryotic mitochondrial regulator protein-domain-containing protein n=1 Tax=Lentithecium fluviatile CBS 122367 TaxID=1168545 RepID=A0A6G1IH66_9PLEO|nr:hypothetical protein K458DRAFT_319668 [Lentithecium fluviatile CBS 122367]
MPTRLRASNLPSTVFPCSSIRPQSIPQPARISREFSQSSCRQITQRRRKFYEWMNGPGRMLKDPLPHSTNYLGAYDKFGNLIRGTFQPKDAKDATPKAEAAEGVEGVEAKPDTSSEGQESADDLDAAVSRSEREEMQKKEDGTEEGRLVPETLEDLRPFPLNRYFRSQPVLSEELREAIYQFVKRDGHSLQLASTTFGVSNERIGAVVRLKQMEKEWIAKGKILAIPYAKAVLDMLPTTPHVKERGKRAITHEPINDLIVHPATRQQLFVPVAESRHFTRVDAGKAFDNNLLPADERIPHPELIAAEKDNIDGYSVSERQRRAQERLEAEMAEKNKKKEEKRQAELASTKTVPQRRWDFVFQDVSVDSVGRNGRDPKGVGWRYGLPHQDRKKGQVKIPTKVEA